MMKVFPKKKIFRIKFIFSDKNESDEEKKINILSLIADKHFPKFEPHRYREYNIKDRSLYAKRSAEENIARRYNAAKR